jgi:hypothetical protein
MPIYAFISDKSRDTSSRSTLNSIRRNHPSIRCESPFPFISVLLDFGVERNSALSFSPEEPLHPATEPCLRIYAPGATERTFVFLKGCPEITKTLHALTSPQKEVRGPSKFTQRMNDLVNVASTGRQPNMLWDKQE